MTRLPPSSPVIVAGAGPAGLSAALTLARAGRAVTVLEASEGPGGIARTVERGGFRFDVGGHRFFTQIPEIQALWAELLGADMRTRQRRSRILFHDRSFDYPLTAGSALRGLGPVESARIVLSYLAARIRPVRPEESIADWFTNHFGRRLFETFFRPYTEKVWGLPCEAIGAQWAAERVRGLSLRAAALDMLRRGAGGQRTLATEFGYPRLGPGMLWQRMQAEIEARGGRVLFGHRLSGVRLERGVVTGVVAATAAGRRELPAGGLVSTIPLGELVPSIDPAPPQDVVAAAKALRYRDFLQVALVLEGREPVKDTWLYLHDPGLRAGRLQNFRAWSPELVPDESASCLGLEYFCQAGDALWSLPDCELVELAARELASLRLGPAPRVRSGHVVRVRHAYPVYDAGIRERTDLLLRGLGVFPNLQLAGRNGLHRYDNMDLAMWTGMQAARRLLGEPESPRAARGGAYIGPVAARAG